MIEKTISFFSEGSRLVGVLYLPDDYSDGQAPTRALVINSGYQGVNAFYPKLLATRMTRFGYTCLGFDYRGMVDSEGQEGRILIDEQVQDVRNAITFLETQPGVDPLRVGLIGWGMGAANVILAAEKGKNVAAVAALNGFYNGRRWLRAIHTYDAYLKILQEVNQDRVQRVLNGESRLADPFVHYPLDPATDDHVQKELAHLRGFGNPTRIQLTESILDLDVDRVVPDLSPIPLFIAHGKDNALHPYSESVALYHAARTPKTLYTVDGRHNDFMYADNPELARLCEALDQFFTDAFINVSQPSRLISA